MKTILVLSNVTTGLVNFRSELLRNLAEKFCVVVLAEDTGSKDDIIDCGCKFEPIVIDRHGINPVKELELEKLYKTKLEYYKPFVVLTFTIKPNVYGGLACASLGIPYISNVTGLGDAIESNGVISFIARSLYKQGLKKATKVFFQNRSNCEYFVQNKMYKGPYDIIPGSGVNLQKHCFEKYPPDDRPIILSVVGRIVKDKGIEEILEASRYFHKDEIIIRLIGNCEGDYLEKIEAAKKHGVIEYVGRKDNIHEWYKTSHAVLHASYHEGMSNVLLEAAACGRPVIATNVPGCKETFDNGVSGIIFEPKNVESLVNAIRVFISIPYETKIQMGIAGRHKMETSFDRNIVVKNYIETIRKIGGGNKNESL